MVLSCDQCCLHPNDCNRWINRCGINNCNAKYIRFMTLNNRFTTRFLAGILFFTAVAKLVSIVNKDKIIMVPDPLFAVQIKWVLIGASIIELIIAYVIWIGSNDKLAAVLALAFSLAAGSYRIIIGQFNEFHMCPCLGAVGSWLGLTAKSNNIIAVSILLLLGLWSINVLIYRNEVRKTS